MTSQSEQPDDQPENSHPGGEDDSTSVGAMPDPDEVDTEAVEAERAERLDPDHRPEGAEVDNTQREFDAEVGSFTDRDDYDPEDRKFLDTGA